MANYEIIIKRIANAIRENPKKLEQLKTVQSISYHLTSDDGVWIEAELYDGNIARYIISGTRSKCVITVNTLTGGIVRKPRNAKPWIVRRFDTNIYRIFDLV